MNFDEARRRGWPLDTPAAVWLSRQTRAGERVAVFNEFGFVITLAIGSELGLDVKPDGAPCDAAPRFARELL